jgi:hypothetical protein
LPKCIDSCVGQRALYPEVCASHSNFMATQGNCVCDKLKELSDSVRL